MQLLEHIHKLTLNPKNAARLKELVLELAVRGKLTEEWRRQNPVVEPASGLLNQIKEEKEKLVNEKKIKKEKPMPPIAEEDIPYELPESWEWCRLGDILNTFLGGNAYKSESFIEESTNQVIRLGNVKNDRLALERNPVFIDDAYASKTKEYKLAKGDLLITMTGTREKKDYCFTVLLDNPIIDNRNLFLNQRVGCLRFNEHTNLNYLSITLKADEVLDQLFSKATGTANQANIGKGAILEALMPVPSLAEQQAIVEVVEQLMRQIEELEQQTTQRIEVNQKLGAASLHQLTHAADDEAFQQHYAFIREHVPLLFDNVENIKKLRESILQLAVQGKLTATWRKQNPDAEPAAELLDRIKEEKERLVKEKKIKKEEPLPLIEEEDILYDLPESWEWCSINELCFKITDGFHHTPKKEKEGIKYISATHIKDNGIHWEDSLSISQKEHDSLYKKAYPRRGEILIVNRGAGCGTPAIINIDEPFSFQNAALIGFNQELVLSTYVYYFLLSKRSEVMDFFIRGGAQPMLSNKILKTILMPLPPFKEQHAIIQTVEQLMQFCDALEEQVTKAKEKEERLMQAIIHHALEGKEEVPIAV